MDFSFLQASPFYELSSLLFIATLVGLVSQWLKQPIILSFLFAGILIGPAFLGIITSYEHIELLSELGITVLLFLVGLKLDLNLLRELGFVSIVAGLGQIILTFILGLFLALSLNFSLLSASLIALALTFSSTIIIVKVLSDLHELETLHGRLSLGYLILQDLVVVFLMMMLGAYNQHHDLSNKLLQHLISIIAYSVCLLVFLFGFIRYLATPLLTFVAKSQELLLIFGIGWALLFASVASFLGFSKELGGLLAGMSLASCPFRESMAAKLAPLRDFLLLFFFISLGAQLTFNEITDNLPFSLIFSFFVLIGKPVILYFIFFFLGYDKRTSFLAAIAGGQVSEFSLIFMALAVNTLGAENYSLGLITIVACITMAASVYLINYANIIFMALKLKMRKSHWKDPKFNANYDVVLFGLGRYGKAITKRLLNKGFQVLAIDFNPQEIFAWKQKGFQALYGDACDSFFIQSLPLKKVKCVLCTTHLHHSGFTEQDPRHVLIRVLKELKFKGTIVVAAHNETEEKELEKLGNPIVLRPFNDAAERTVEKLEAIIRI